MAVNLLTTVMVVLQLLFLYSLCASAISKDVSYDVSSSHAARGLELSFALHGDRYRRQAPATAAPTNVHVDDPTSPGMGALPDDSSQPGSSNDNKSSTTTTTTTTSTTTTTTSSTTTTSTITPVQTVPTTTYPWEEADQYHDYHDYYTSDALKDRLNDYWVELADAPRHETLSTGHRVAAVIPLKFPFNFYGHKIDNVTVATGGFIYMSPFLHQWLTATQYIAPLMANFDPSMSSNSNIYYQSLDTSFTVEWKDVMLKDQNETGKFHFQAILKKDSSIIFVYKKIPIPVSRISTEEHPVKVGLSDAYYNDTIIPQSNIKRRTIYEYHKVVIQTSRIMDGTVIELKPLPTCNLLDNCDSCTRHENMAFDCRWCNIIGRCSDGLDWYRQHWDKQGCQTLHTQDPRECASLPPPTKPIVDPLNPQYPEADRCADGKCDKNNDFPVAVIVVLILIIVGLLAAVGGWVYYAYTHPTSRSGMWLMEHRPSQIKAKIKFWKSNTDNGTKYKVESTA